MYVPPTRHLKHYVSSFIFKRKTIDYHDCVLLKMITKGITTSYYEIVHELRLRIILQDCGSTSNCASVLDVPCCL